MVALYRTATPAARTRALELVPDLADLVGEISDDRPPPDGAVRSYRQIARDADTGYELGHRTVACRPDELAAAEAEYCAQFDELRSVRVDSEEVA
jgi:hypothetical protein